MIKTVRRTFSSKKKKSKGKESQESLDFALGVFEGVGISRGWLTKIGE